LGGCVAGSAGFSAGGGGAELLHATKARATAATTELCLMAARHRMLSRCRQHPQGGPDETASEPDAQAAGRRTGAAAEPAATAAR
jgi:hypothetical protein